MNHTFTTRTWGGNKPVANWITITCAIAGILLIISIIGFLPGAMLISVPIAEYVFHIRTTCPSCKAKVSVFRNAKAYSCYNCQTVFAKKNNQWEIIIEDKKI